MVDEVAGALARGVGGPLMVHVAPTLSGTMPSGDDAASVTCEAQPPAGYPPSEIRMVCVTLTDDQGVERDVDCQRMP